VLGAVPRFCITLFWISSAAVVTSADSILTAIGKLQAQQSATASISTTGGSTTLSSAQYGCPATLVMPVNGVWTVANRTTGAFTLTVKTASGTGIAVAQAQTQEVIADGTNVVIASTDFATTGFTAAVKAAVPGVSLTMGWGGGALVTAGTYVFTATAPFGFTITSMDASVGSVGSTGITANVRIAGTSVTGLSAASITSSTKTNFAATGANTVTAGQQIDVVLTLTGAPAGAYLCLNGTRT
jgi:hypothetical protein